MKNYMVTSYGTVRYFRTLRAAKRFARTLSWYERTACNFYVGPVGGTSAGQTC